MLANPIVRFANRLQDILDSIRGIDFLGPLALRLYLAPVFWAAANNKWNPLNQDSSLQSVIDWFGNKEWGLGLPFPEVMAYLAWGAEYFGAILLVLGLAVRWICIPLMVTMLVAAFTVHAGHGWQAVHDLLSPFPADNAPAALERLGRAKEILREHGNYEWLTEHGSVVALNNGVEWSVTYFIMLLALFFIGAGKVFSLDFWIAKKLRDRTVAAY